MAKAETMSGAQKEWFAQQFVNSMSIVSGHVWNSVARNMSTTDGRTVTARECQAGFVQAFSDICSNLNANVNTATPTSVVLEQTHLTDTMLPNATHTSSRTRSRLSERMPQERIRSSQRNNKRNQNGLPAPDSTQSTQSTQPTQPTQPTQSTQSIQSTPPTSLINISEFTVGDLMLSFNELETLLSTDYNELCDEEVTLVSPVGVTSPSLTVDGVRETHQMTTVAEGCQSTSTNPLFCDEVLPDTDDFFFDAKSKIETQRVAVKRMRVSLVFGGQDGYSFRRHATNLNQSFKTPSHPRKRPRSDYDTQTSR